LRLLNQLADKHGNDINEKSLTICSGLDMVNINYLHVVCPSVEVAKVKAHRSDSPETLPRQTIQFLCQPNVRPATIHAIQSDCQEYDFSLFDNVQLT